MTIRITLFILLSCFVNTLHLHAENRFGALTTEQVAQAESLSPTIQSYLEKHAAEFGLSPADVQQWEVSDIYSNQNTHTTYAYLQQVYKGVRVFNAVSTMAIREGQVISFASRFIPKVDQKANGTRPAVKPTEAIAIALEYLSMKSTSRPQLTQEVKALDRFIFSYGEVSTEPVQVTLVYLPGKEKVTLSWNVNIAPRGSDHWWNLRFDAQTGRFLEKNDWTVQCDFGAPATSSNASGTSTTASHAATAPHALPVYNVYAFPTEAPSFGPRVLLSNPADATASPYGWHDTNGQPGDEFTTTQGNNVHAYDDIANQDAPGTSADGGATMNFDFPVNFSQAPSSYLDASLTNLFYVNNWVHDVLFHYGLDESGGNFQQTNYSGQGAGNDYVLAECQDGGGTNNANFSTPDDGQNGRMQMYLWSGGSAADLQVNSPSSVAGNYTAIQAGFGPTITAPITADMVLINDDVAPASDGCDNILNAAQLSGKIVVIDRGTCTFIQKVNTAEAAGAVAVVVINNQAGSPISMGGTGTSGIPAVMISQADGNLLKTVLSAGGVINATLNPPAVVVQDLDGSLDNGIVAHEYGHGVSNRLTGGPNSSNCLNNGEQGGEGWSDWFALVFTIKAGDQGSAARGIGTYALSEPTSGSGIRRYPYSTDMSINPQTYADLALSSEVHDIGEIWCQTLWDMTWTLIDNFGFDPDWINGTSGNNIALKLVMEGMKLQPCGPGFLDARDAILSADDNLYGGIHKCLIWEAFARRGLGANADQGSAQTAGDETADFTLPSFCQNPTAAPVADFTVDVTTTCFGTVRFIDLSTNIAQSWQWDFGDGSTSSIQNPVHVYTQPGTYAVTLVVTNTIGSDTLLRNGYISVTNDPAPSLGSNFVVCQGDSTTLTAILLSGYDATWYDATGNEVGNGSVFTTPAITSNTSYSVRQFIPTPIQHVGPVNNAFGGGGYHNTAFEGKQLFTTYAPARIVSVWVDASGAANRTFNLYNGNGTLMESRNIFVPSGQSRVTLNFDMPVTGNYQLGVTAGSNLYRNNTGASYPYTINGLLSITASNSTTNPAIYYYYVYDWEVQELPCLSAPAAANVDVEPLTASFTESSNGLTVQFTNTSVAATGYLWDFGDGNTSTLQDPINVYAADGNYTVTLTTTSATGCQVTYSVSLTVTSTGVNDKPLDGIKVFANQQQLIIDRGQVLQGPMTVKVYDVLGRTVIPAFTTNDLSVVRLSLDIPVGVLQVEVRIGETVFHQKVFMQ